MKNSIYAPYTKMPSVPAGAILNRLIAKQSRKKIEIAAESDLIPQRLNDLITGNRRFNPDNSLALEKTLGIDIAGFFYLIQANHDIYEKLRKIQKKNTPDLSALTKSTFWDVVLDKVDWASCQNWAIRRVLEYGNADEIRELDRFYGRDVMMSVYEKPEGFRLYKKVKQNMEALIHGTAL